MKKTIITFLTFPIFIFASSVFLVSCSSAKKYKEENTLLKSEFQIRDSIKNIIINQAIDDKLITPVVQSSTGNPILDSLVNAKVDEILSKLNTSKNSGENSYTLFYDKLAKQLEFYSKIAQTKNENTATKTTDNKKFIQIKKIPVEIEKPLSKLEKLLLALGILTLLFLAYKIVIFIRNKTSLWT